MSPSSTNACASGITIHIFGWIAVGAGLRHGSVLSIALGAALLVLTVLVYLVGRRGLRGIGVTREAPESAFEGDDVEVRLLVRNDSRVSVFYPAISDHFAPELHAQKDATVPLRVRPGETVTEAYRGECLLPRGVYVLGPTTVSVSDPLGWFRHRKRLSGSAQIKIYPRFQLVGSAERLGRSLSPILDDRPRFGIGESNEFFAVREYRVGDPLRRVHWPLTAHRGYPVVREHTRTTVGELVLFLDLYRLGLLGVGRGSSLEQGVKIVASLASRAIEKGHRVRFVARGGADRFHVPPGRGKAHLTAILDALILVRPDGTAPLDAVVEEHGRRIPAGATVVLPVGPYLQGSARFQGQIATLRRNGARVVLLVLDGATFTQLHEIRDHGLSAADYVERLRARGFEALLVPCGASPAALFARMRRRRRSGVVGGAV